MIILSHGNARVESEFSINADLLQVNMLEENVVSQRIVYEAIQYAGGPTMVEINKETEMCMLCT